MPDDHQERGAQGCRSKAGVEKPGVRARVVASATIEKAGIVVAFALIRRRPFARGLRMVVVFDTACVLLYAAWLVTS